MKEETSELNGDVGDNKQTYVVWSRGVKKLITYTSVQKCGVTDSFQQ